MQIINSAELAIMDAEQAPKDTKKYENNMEKAHKYMERAKIEYLTALPTSSAGTTLTGGDATKYDEMMGLFRESKNGKNKDALDKALKIYDELGIDKIAASIPEEAKQGSYLDAVMNAQVAQEYAEKAVEE